MTLTPVNRATRTGYAAILWESGAEMDDAIRLLRTFDGPDEAIRSIAPDCNAGERWAVVDLTRMSIVAEGASTAARVG